MNIKKIAAFAAAAVMAAGVCAGVPVSTENASLLSVTAEAASSDFVIETDGGGFKYVSEYKGNGGDIKIPSGVAYVGAEVFTNNNTITSVTFPKSCDYVYDNSFAVCLNLKKVVFEGDASAGTKAFDFCINLESVTVKGSLNGGLSSGAFRGCINLKTVKIEKNEYDFIIGESAFQDCYSLTSINIPDKCTDIYGRAFLNCFSLTKLTIPAKTKINEGNNVTAHFGYAALFKSKAEAEKAIADQNSNAKISVFAADGKTKGYSVYYEYKNGKFNRTAKQYTPKQLTLTVTKGSPAEKWAKANKVKYVYAKTTKTTTTKK